MAHGMLIRRLRRRRAVTSQLFGCRENNGRRAAGSAAGVDHEPIALLRAAAPIEANAVVAWLAGALAIETSWLLFAAIVVLVSCRSSRYACSGALTTSLCALCMAYVRTHSACGSIHPRQSQDIPATRATPPLWLRRAFFLRSRHIEIRRTIPMVPLQDTEEG